MKVIIYICLSFLALIAIGLITAAILPKDFHAEGKTTINKSVDEVYNYVKYLKTQEAYTV
jgi:hypothetical protein